MKAFGPLVSTQWLAEHLGEARLKVIDGSWRMPGQGSAHDDYGRRHIPGAVFFDIDAVSDPESPLPHMLPPQAVFERAAGALGVSDKDRVVVYDDQGLFSAARVWWTFRAMGHADVAVLNGGLPKWLAEERPTTADSPAIASAVYEAAPVQALRRTAGEVRAALSDKSASVVDARPAARFSGAAPEPRAGLRSGRMPGAVNVPFSSLIDGGGALHAPAAVRAVFETAGADLSLPVITTCGSGVTAAVLSLALEAAGHYNHGLYDGSWAEWGDERHDDKDWPVVAGA